MEEKRDTTQRLITKITSIKTNPTTTGKTLCKFKTEAENFEFTTWDMNIIGSLKEGMDVDFTYRKSVKPGSNGVVYTNYNVIDWYSDIEPKKEYTPEEKEKWDKLDKEVNMYGQAMATVPKEPHKYTAEDFAAIQKEFEKIKEENKVLHQKITDDGIITTQIDITNNDLQAKTIIVPNVIIKEPGNYTVIFKREQ